MDASRPAMALQALQVAQAIGYFEFQPWNILPSLVFLPYIARSMLHIPCCRKTILCTHPILVGYFGYFIHIHTVLVASFIPFLLSHLSHSTHFRSSPWPEAPRPKARPERQPVPRSLAPLTLASSAVISAGWPGRNCLKAWEQAWSVSQILTKWPELLNWIQTKHDKAVWRLKISLNWPWHQAIPSQIDACLNTPGSVQVCCSQICSYSCSLNKLNDCDWLCALSQQCCCACRFNVNLLGCHKLTENWFVPVVEWSF